MSELRRKIILTTSGTIGTVMSTMAYASGTQHIAYPIISRIWNIMISLAFMSGIILMATSVIQLIQSIKDEDAESKAKAIRSVAVSLALMSFQLLLDPILATLGFMR